MKVLVSTHLIVQVESLEDGEEVREAMHQSALLNIAHQLEIHGFTKADGAPDALYLGTALVQVPDLDLASYEMGL